LTLQSLEAVCYSVRRKLRLFSIGEFSSASGIPVRTLRFYHEQGILVPAAVDSETNYRSYDLHNLEVARIIVALRELEFSLDDIREILTECHEDADVLDHLERQKASFQQKLGNYKNLVARIDRLIYSERTARERNTMSASAFRVEERLSEPLKIAGIRMTGSYSDCGQGFATLYKRLGRRVCGKPMCLFYDGEYRAEDANFEPCVPVRNEVEIEGVMYQELPGCRCLSLMHRGPYEELSRSYARILLHAKERGCEVTLPTREVYHKGPGMLFRGNPQKYLTEIQLPIRP
jgi:DNA-binding transcriptional MerR regulator/effector-binding domain-containing protein